jgi:hypothetical protein
VVNQKISVLVAVLLAVSPSAGAAGLAVNFDGAASRMLLELSEVPAVPKGVLVPQRAVRGRARAADVDAMIAQLAQQHKEIPTAAVRKALTYWRDHAEVLNKDYVAIADFDRASKEKRLSVIKMSDGSVVSYWAAHGVGSGGLYATKFSNEDGTHMSSLGIYVTAEEYQGEHGRSMKLHGMEATNSAAEARAIVMHSADYVSQAYINEHGMLGQSWGCPAVENKYIGRLIDQLKGGAVLLIYHS